MADGEVRGSRPYDDGAVRARFLAHRHSGTASPNQVMEEPAFLRALGAVAGLRVLDLGCGDGTTAHQVLDRGAAEYVGVDGSAAMVAVARREAEGDRARFVHQDIEDLVVPDGAFDVVTSRMALHHVADLAGVVASARCALRPGGRLLFSVVHPVISSPTSGRDGPRTSWTVDDYFRRGPRHRPWLGSTATWHHHTVEDHVAAVLGAGLVLDLISECAPDAGLLAHDPAELERRRRVPLMLLVGASRPDR